MKYRNVSVKSLPSYIKKKFILLVVPYVVWYVLVPKYVSNVSLATMLNPLTIIKQTYIVVIEYKGLWFLLAFFSLSVGFYIRELLIKQKGGGEVIVETISIFFLASIYYGVYKLTGNLLWKISFQYVPIFAVGCWMNKYIAVNKVVISKTTFNWALPVFLLISSQYIYNVNNELKMVVGMLSIPVFAWLAQNMHINKTLKSGLLMLGRYSLAIYCMHSIFLCHLDAPIKNDWWLRVIATAIAVVVSSTCVLITIVLEKSVPLNWLLFGKQQKK